MQGRSREQSQGNRAGQNTEDDAIHGWFCLAVNSIAQAMTVWHLVSFLWSGCDLSQAWLAGLLLMMAISPK